MASVPRKGVSVKDVRSHEFIKAYAAHLERTGKVELPKWADIVKTAPYKELAPYEPDWFFLRCASLARHIYMRGGKGVGAFRKMYGGRYNRGVQPEKFARAAGSIIRKALQELEKIGVVEKHPNGGRRITQNGQRDLDRIAAQVGK
eukprot:TRINITY_DN37889_c0_g1_i1.p2 TRINITY_DN37889_c0_g1~~TRINITY_DN37889_c0_g1_i1.p2  ORF type:complete len:162 (+),score=26.42 TRINITY_DN37889_c0_g1_i1:49-486(+)